MITYICLLNYTSYIYIHPTSPCTIDTGMLNAYANIYIYTKTHSHLSLCKRELQTKLTHHALIACMSYK